MNKKHSQIKKTSCVIYARAASQDLSKNANSLLEQVKRLEGYAQVNHLKIKESFLEIGSGAVINPKLKEMLAYMEANGIENILTNDINRIARNDAIFTEICNLAYVKQITTPSYTFHLDNKGDALMLTILRGIESTMHSVRSIQAKQAYIRAKNNTLEKNTHGKH